MTYKEEAVGRGGERWSRERILAAVAAFVAQQDTWPLAVDWSAPNGLPGHDTMRKVFGSTAACRQAYIEQYGPLPAPAPPPRPAVVPCLKCGAWWETPDRTRWRLCEPCRVLPPGESTGEWMGTGAVVDRGVHADEADAVVHAGW